jgi:hypothetical protein
MKFLFVCYGGGHVEMCLPVIRALRSRRLDCDIQLMALTTGAKIARQAGEHPLGYSDFLTGPEADLTRDWGKRLLPENQHPDVNLTESVAYLGLNFMEWVAELGEESALQRWESIGRQGFFPFRFFTRVLQQLRPDVVIVTNSPRSEQAVLAAAVALGIPSLSMLDLFGLPGDPYLARPVHADRITVLSNEVADNLVRGSIARDRIFVTGNPAFDVLTQPCAKREGQDWRVERGWQDKHVVLWAGHLEPRDAEFAWAGTALGDAVVQRLVSWIERRKDAALVIRYHPNEWQHFNRPPAHPRIHWSQPGQENLTPVLMGSDQVVVQGSTVGAQAYTAGKRLICLGFSPMAQRSGMDYAAFGMGVRAASLEELQCCLDDGFKLSCNKDATVIVHAAQSVASHIVALAARKS